MLFAILAFFLPSARADWIATLAPRSSWNEAVASLPSDTALRRTFGPGRRFALMSGRLPSARLRGIARSQPNHVYRALDFGDPALFRSWGLVNHGQKDANGQAGLAHRDVGAELAWEMSEGLSEIVVGIVDSGVDVSHEELVGRLWRNPIEIEGNGVDDDGNGLVDDAIGWDFVDGDETPQDGYGHGTLVAGIVGAAAHNGRGSRGLAPNSRLLVAKCLDAAGFGTTESAVRAIQYAVEGGARVLNLSWGGTRYDPVLYETLKWAESRGVLAVIAAGNAGESNDESKTPIYPSSFPLGNLLSVAAYDNRDTLWPHSSWGKRTVHLGAPGVAVFGPWKGGGYATKDGTSFAAPFVAATAALVLGKEPTLSVASLRSRLIEGSEVIHYYEKERTFSAGRVQAANAMADRRPPRPRPPSKWDRRLESMATPHPYDNDAMMTFLVREPGAAHLRVRFRGFSTEACCDTVTLRDGNGRIVASYSGERGDFWSADALGDTIEIELRTDYVTRGWGFEIDAVEYARAEAAAVAATSPRPCSLSLAPALEPVADAGRQLLGRPVRERMGSLPRVVGDDEERVAGEVQAGG